MATIEKNVMKLLNTGKIRNHKLLDHARIHTCEGEKKEVNSYRDFLTSKNCSIVCQLTGSDNLQ